MSGKENGKEDELIEYGDIIERLAISLGAHDQLLIDQEMGQPRWTQALNRWKLETYRDNRRSVNITP